MIRDKRILITGATGQVAGALARGLAKENEVIALARFSAAGSREALEAAGIKTVLGDFVTGELPEAPEVDYVVHAAANTRPADSNEAMRDNVEGTGLLMQHYRHAKAFLHISTTCCYVQHPDPRHVYNEDDEIGGGSDFCPLYGVSKTAAEGVVRTLARLLQLPATIVRLNTAYGGPYADGGLPGRMVDAVLAGSPIQVPKGSNSFQALIHEDDLTAHVLPLLAAASVPATIVNWGGDEGVDIETWVKFIGEVVGKEPNLVYENCPWPSFIGDNRRRIALGCECKVDWRSGIRRMVEARHPELALVSSAA